MRVLVIDDEPDILFLCRVNLGFAGHEVLEAPDGERGMELAMRDRPDLIVLDVMLPALDGLSPGAASSRAGDRAIPGRRFHRR